MGIHQASLQKAEAAMEERRLDKPLGPNLGRLRISELDQRGLQFIEAQAEKLVNGGIAVLEKFHEKVGRGVQRKKACLFGGGEWCLVV